MVAANYKHAISVLLALAAGFMVFSLFESSSGTVSVAPRGAQPTGELVPLLSSMANSLAQLSKQQSAAAPKRVKLQVAGANDLAKHVRSISGLINKINASHKPGAAAAAAAAQKLASSTTPAPTYNFRQISSLSDDRCLDAGTFITLSGVKLYGCNQGLPQGFWVTENGMIRHSSGHCLQLREGETNVRFVACDAVQPSQRWELLRTVTARRSGTPFRNKLTQLCLDHQGDVLVGVACSDACSQLWLPTVVQGSKMASAAPAAPAKPKPHMQTKEVLLCWAIFEAATLGTLAVAVNNTWGRDCDTLVIFSTEKYAGLDIVVLEGGPSNPLWNRIQQAWMYLYAHHYNTADWFFKADEDTYVVVPYLREFVSRQPPGELAHYGRRLQYSGLPGNENLYVSGGSGLLMNRVTLGKVGAAIEKDSNAWAGPSTGPADLLMSRTLNKLGALPKDTRDVEGRHVFIALGLEMEYGSTRAKSPDLWFWKYSPDARDGKECCSKRWITAHYFKPAQMYSLYEMQQLGCNSNPNAYPYLYVPKASEAQTP